MSEFTGYGIYAKKKTKGIKKMAILEHDEDRIGVVFRKLSLFLATNFITHFQFFTPAVSILTLITADIQFNLHQFVWKNTYYFLLLYKSRAIWIRSQWDYFQARRFAIRVNLNELK